ncbi:TssQ family T6SS-associated lipoprotein [Noviherbaspirillum massiliense]|uniref:TssQ family T6SS-associated lipoprotein n=1 Tax=Noviherbaspirillum massiliense TaxID=1465823 RepID=UPI000318E377|nr:TssQ family T6SS-associated lipoprotein [Noviherbaspirillum massiliense]
MLLAGCEVIERVKTDIQKAIANHPLNSSSSRSPAQTALKEGVDLYEKGDFNGAIKHLSNSPEIWSPERNIPVQTKALKYMAFSYCVTSRQALCKQQFEKALRLDPDFDLEPGEKGHPLWGRIFESAKRSK